MGVSEVSASRGPRARSVDERAAEDPASSEEKLLTSAVREGALPSGKGDQSPALTTENRLPPDKGVKQAMLSHPPFGGLLGVLVFGWFSLLPSLLPRSWVVQAAVSAIFALMGYSIGNLVGWVAHVGLRRAGITLGLRLRTIGPSRGRCSWWSPRQRWSRGSYNGPAGRTTSVTFSVAHVSILAAIALLRRVTSEVSSAMGSFHQTTLATYGCDQTSSFRNDPPGSATYYSMSNLGDFRPYHGNAARIIMNEHERRAAPSTRTNRRRGRRLDRIARRRPMGHRACPHR